MLGEVMQSIFHLAFIAATVRFAGERGQQHTMFFLDPFGNSIELKGFADLTKVFS
jgi:extradiol dioxygenase family protein